MLSTTIKRQIVTKNFPTLSLLKKAAPLSTIPSTLYSASAHFSTNQNQDQSSYDVNVSVDSTSSYIPTPKDEQAINSSNPSFVSHLFRSSVNPSQYDPSFGTLYQFKHMTDLAGKDFDFKHLQGKVLLVTNVACDCGYTKSGYQHLVEFKNSFEKDPFEVVAFPSDSFNQEKRSPSEIKEFVSQFGVNFPMMAKSDVNGENQNVIYKYLKRSFPGKITWNFSSYFLINHQGVPIARFEKESWDEIKAAIDHAVQDAKAADKENKESKK